MLHYISDFEVFWGPLRLFQYVTFRAGGAFFTAILLSMLFGNKTIKILSSLQTVAPARLKGLVPDEYIDSAKDKTPSMGGVLIIFSVLVSTLLWAIPNNQMLWVFCAVLLLLGAVGFLDDYTKIAFKKRDGISAKLKFTFQVLVAVAAVYSLDMMPATADFLRQIYLPFLKNPIITGLPLILVVIFGALVVVASSNAVNLTDGKDGLAAGCSIFASLAYAIFAYFCGHKVFASYLNIPYIPGSSEVVVFAMAICGGCIGFLWFNCHPAAMFMGDTGSLALGGSIGLISVLVRQELNLIVIGAVFVIEALSVIIQVTSFKIFGKRVFLCSPIHHHFERKGWTETQIVVRFWILAGIFAILGIATLKIR